MNEERVEVDHDRALVSMAIGLFLSDIVINVAFCSKGEGFRLKSDQHDGDEDDDEEGDQHDDNCAL